MSQNYYGSFIISNNGELIVFGDNYYGNLGTGDTNNVLLPTIINGFNGVKQIACAHIHTYAVLNNGNVMVWGDRKYNQGVGSTEETTQLTPLLHPYLSNVKQIAAGNYHTLVLLNDGTVKAFGSNGFGQLGIGNTTYQYSPVIIPGLSSVKRVFCGGNHSMVLLNDGTVKSFGYNVLGQLGIGNTSQTLSPTIINNLINVKDIYCGGDYSLFLLEDGTVKGCGGNTSGQIGNIGDQTTYPYSINGLSNVKQINGGYLSSFAVLNDGTVKSFGLNNNGQLGLGNTNNYSTPTLIPNLSNVKFVSAGYFNTIFQLNDGTIKVCGLNANWQLGLGNTTAYTSPVLNPYVSDAKSLWDIYDLGMLTKYIYKKDSDIWYFNVTWQHNANEIIEATFTDYGMDVLPSTLPPVVSPDLFYYYGDELTSATAKITSVNNKLILAKGDIDLNSANNLNSVTLNANITGGSTIKMIVSVDSGSTWKTFNNTEWVNIIPSETDVNNNGITKVNFNNITKEQWGLLFGSTPTKIRFGYLLNQSLSTELCNTDSIAINIDMVGKWKTQPMSTGFTTSFDGRSGDLIKVNLLSSGDFKINY